MIFSGKRTPEGGEHTSLLSQEQLLLQAVREMHKDTLHKTVEVDVSGRPSAVKTDKPKEERRQQEKFPVTRVHILVDLRISNGLHLKTYAFNHRHKCK